MSGPRDNVQAPDSLAQSGQHEPLNVLRFPSTTAERLERQGRVSARKRPRRRPAPDDTPPGGQAA